MPPPVCEWLPVLCAGDVHRRPQDRRLVADNIRRESSSATPKEVDQSCPPLLTSAAPPDADTDTLTLPTASPADTRLEGVQDFPKQDAEAAPRVSSVTFVDERPEGVQDFPKQDAEAAPQVSSVTFADERQPMVDDMPERQPSQETPVRPPRVRFAEDADPGEALPEGPGPPRPVAVDGGIFLDGLEGSEAEQGHDWQVLLRSMEARTKTLAKLVAEQEKELQQMRIGYKVGPRVSHWTTAASTERSVRPSVKIRESTWSTDSDAKVCVTPSMLPTWTPKNKKDKKKVKQAAQISKLKRNSAGTYTSGDSENPSDAEDNGKGPAPAFGIVRRSSSCVLSPASPTKMCWDLLSAIVIGYDVIVLPLGAFGYDSLRWAAWAALVTTIFWTIDLVVSLCSGFHREDGLVEMMWKRTAVKYLRTWFPIDIVVLSLDWSLFIFGIESEEAVSAGRMNRVSRFLKIVRLLRFTRLIRIVKLAHIFQELCQYVLTAEIVTCLSILRLLAVLSIFVHYIACSWYAVGDLTSDSWLREWKERQTSPGYLYAICYHWALAQFLPAPATDAPTNFTERIFTIVILFLGFVLFSSTLGSVTALITATRKSTYDKMAEGHMLRKFFTYNEISHHVASRVLHFQSKSRSSSQQGIFFEEVPFFRRLPPSLKADVLYEMHLRIVLAYPFLEALDDSWHPAVQDICHSAVVETVVHKEDVVFRFGTEALSTRFVKSGRLVYYPKVDWEMEDFGTVITTPSQYLSEAALWTSWLHQGLAVAADTTRLVCLSREAFAHAVHAHLVVLNLCMEYSKLYFLYLSKEHLVGDVDDTFRAFRSKLDLFEASKEMRPRRLS